MIGPRFSIKVRFSVTLTVIITIVILSISIPLIILNARLMDNRLNDQISQLIEFSEETLPSALWQYNYDYAKDFFDSLFLFQDVSYAVLTVKNTEIIKKTRPGFQDDAFSRFESSEDFFTAKTDILFKGRRVGTIFLVFSRERIQKQIMTNGILAAFIIFLLTASVLATNIKMFNGYIFTPLLNLEASVKKIAKGDMDADIEVNRDDEIGQLAKSFEKMMYNLKKITASRDELNHEIRQRRLTEYRIEILNEIKEDLLGSSTLEKKLQLISEGVVRILNADFVRIWGVRPGDRCRSCRHHQVEDDSKMCKDGTKCLHLLASSGRYTSLEDEYSRMPMSYCDVEAFPISAEKSSGFYINHLDFENPIYDPEWAGRLNLKSFAGYALRSHDKAPIGVMALFSQDEVSPKDNTLLETIAGTASQVIQVSMTQERLSRSEKRYRTLFENAQIGMFQSRINDGKIIESNFRMAQILGYDSPEACVAKYIADEHYLDPSQREEVMELLNTNGEIVNHQIRIRLDDGSIKWIQFSGLVSEDPDYFEGVAADITEQKDAEEKVQASLNEKEVLLREIHHRVKNSLQMIQSLLSLQSNEIKDPEQKKPLVDSNSRIKSMALIHETLYHSDDIAKLNVSHYIRDIVSYLKKIYNQPGIDVEIDLFVGQVEMNMDLCISCGLVVNELVSNAMKYAFTGRTKGKISLTLREMEPNRVELIIEDDGCGFGTLDKKNDGVDSLGLKIVNLIVKGQLRGTIDFKNTTGVTCTITFPFSPSSPPKSRKGNPNSRVFIGKHP